jgi:hypothetical protein
MAYVKEPDLFLLIKSLSRGEKRFVKLNSTLYEKENESQIMRLFDLLDRMEKFDEAELKKVFSSSVLNVLKTRLYSTVMLLLGQMHTDRTVETKIFSLLAQFQVLRMKGMHAASLKILEKAKMRCLATGRYELAAEVVRCYKEVSFGVKEQEMVWEFEFEISQKMHLISMLTSISGYLESYYHQNGFARSRVEFDSLENKAGFLQEVDVHSENGTEILFHYHHAKAWYFLITGKTDLAKIHLLDVFQLMSDTELVALDPKWIDRELKIRLLFIRICLTRQEWLEAELALEDLSSRELGYSYRDEFFALSIEFYLKTGNFEYCKSLVDMASAQFQKFNAAIQPRQFELVLNVVRYYLFADELRPAVRFANQVIKQSEGEWKKVYLQAELINQMCYFCNDHSEIMESTRRSFRRKMLQEDISCKFEIDVIESLHNISQAKEQRKQSKLLELKQRVESLLDDEFEGPTIVQSEWLVWLNAYMKSANPQLIFSERLQNHKAG